MNELWLKRELRRLKLNGLTDDYLGRVRQKIERSQDLNGLQVAAGIGPIPGKDPYLASCAANNACEAGAVVAEIRYRVAAVSGVDVFGKPVEPPHGEHLDSEVGEGIERIESVKFKATQSGLLKIKDRHISVQKTWTCEGDFNVNSSIPDFKGNIVIKGNVEVGAVVTASGDIIVEGSVRGASVRCGGDLTVKGGVSTSENALIRCDGNMKVGFIEGAKIICRRNLTVDTSIVQSDVSCAGDATVTASDGRVGASTMYIWGNLSVSKIGFATGAPTYIHLGEDWKEAKRTATLKNRFNCLSECLDKYRSEERTLAQMKPSQLNKKRLEQKIKLQRDIQRLDSIVRLVVEKIESLRGVKRLNASSNLKTTFASEGDTEITVAGVVSHQNAA